MKKIGVILLSLISLSAEAAPCVTCPLGPNGINQWQLIYQVGQCVNTSADIICSKIDNIGSVMDGCNTCSAFDVVTSELNVIDSKIDFISMSLFDAIFELSTIIESVLEKIYDTVTAVDSITDVLLSKIDVITSELDVCDFCSVVGAISTKIDTLSTNSSVCCNTLSTFDVIIKSDIDSVSTKVDSVSSKIDILSSKADACCSLLDSDLRSIGNVLSTTSDACCATLSAFDVILKSDIDSVSTKVDGVNAQVTACCALLSTLDTILKSDIDSVSTKIDGVNAQITACCALLSAQDSLIKSDIDSVSTKVDGVSSQITVLKSDLDNCCSLLDSDLRSIGNVLSTTSDACCATLSAFDVILKSDIDSVSTKVDGVNAQVTACCALLSILDTILKSDIDSVSTKVDGVNTQVTACCALLSTLDTIIKSDVDSVSTKVDGTSSQITVLKSDLDSCCATLSAFDVIIKSDIDSVSSKIDKLSVSACDQTAVLSELDVLSSKVMSLESLIEELATAPQPFVSCFGDGLSMGRNEFISIDFQYGTDGYDTTTTVANAGSIITANSMITLQTGTNAAGSALIQSNRELRYRASHEGYCFFTAAFPNGGAANSTQWIGLFNASDGMAVGYGANNGTTFSILYRSSATGALVNIIVPQASFNVDILNGSGPSGINLVPTNLNIFRLSYGWLGAATLNYEIFRSDCTWHVFHQITLANTSATPGFSNPVLPMSAQVTNTGNTSNLQLVTGGWNAGIIGDFSHVAQRIFSETNTGKAVNTTEIPLLSIRNNAAFQSISNHIEARLYAFGGGDFGSSNGRLLLRLRKNATLTGAAFASVNVNSIMSFDTTATAVSGGTLLLISPAMNESGGPTINYLSDADVDIFMVPGDVLTLTAQSDTGAGGTNTIGMLTWAELF